MLPRRAPHRPHLRASHRRRRRRRRDRHRLRLRRRRLPGRLRRHQPVAGRLRRQRHRHQPRRPDQRLVADLDLHRRPDGHPGLERHRHPVRQPGHRDQRRLQRGARHRTPAPRSASTARGPRSNPVPSSFALNGTTCTGGVAPTTATDAPRTADDAAGRPRRRSPPTTTTSRRTPADRCRRPPPAGSKWMERLNRGRDQRPVRQRQPGLLAAARHRPGQRGLQRLPRHTKVNASPITGSTNYLDAGAAAGSPYTVRAGRRRRRAGGVGGRAAVRQRLPRRADAVPPGGTTPSGEAYTYSANDASVGDLDGDGQLRDRAQVGPVQRQGQLPVRLHRQRLSSTRTGSTAPGCGASTWAATSGPARTTPSSRCTTTTATAGPRSP